MNPSSSERSPVSVERATMGAVEVPIDWNAVSSEAIGWFKDLLRIDTTNPPGNERPAAEYVVADCSARGHRARDRSRASRRAQAWSRACADPGRRAPLLLNGHLDVVPADRGALAARSVRRRSRPTAASGAAARST